MKAKFKNILLLSTYLLGHLPSMFFGIDTRYSLSLLGEKTSRIDFFALYYCWAITFVILAYCLWSPKGINKRIIKFIFIVSLLDFLHLIVLAMQGFGVTKFGIAMVIVFIPEIMSLFKSLTDYLKKICQNLTR